MLTSEIASSIFEMQFDHAAARYRTSCSADNWTKLCEAMLVLQQWRQVNTDAGLVKVLEGLPLSGWPEAVVYQATGGRSIAQVMK